MSKFPNSRLKIDRAYTHIHELEQLIAWYCAPDLHSPILQHDAAGHSKMVLQSEPIPPQTALIVGDAIHCLRAALDHAAYTMTTGKVKKEFISFPFGKDRASLEGLINGGNISVAGPAVTKAIVEQIKPYLIDENTGEQGNPALWAMNKLDNIDKHREILLATAEVETHIESLTFPPQYNIAVHNNTFGSVAGQHHEIINIDIPILHAQGTTTVEIVFNEPEFFPGESVLPTLLQLAELTTGAIDILEPLA